MSFLHEIWYSLHGQNCKHSKAALSPVALGQFSVFSKGTDTMKMDQKPSTFSAVNLVR